MKSTKAFILGALVIVMSIVIIGISVSYSYYINIVEEVNSANQGVSVTSGELTMNFSTSQYISASAAGLIKDADILTKADYTAFSISLPSDADANSALYSLYLTDTSMTSNFKSSYLKWALYNGTTKVADGDFNSVTLSNESNGVYQASDITLLNNVSIAKGNTTSYKLYVWLGYSETENQNSLLEGSLSTKVGFRAVTQ